MVFEKEYIMRCSSAEWIARNGCALRWCHRGVGRETEETVGFPEWTARLSVWKTTGKDSSETCAIACQNCAFYSVFPSGVSSHSKIAQFNWECIGRYTVCVKTKKCREQSCYMSVRDTHRPLASNPANRRTWMIPGPFLRLFPVSCRGANSI